MTRQELLTVLFVIACVGSVAAAGQVPAPSTAQALAVGEGTEIRVPPAWEKSPVSYANATELVVVRRVTSEGAAGRENAVEVPQARMLITSERRLNHDDALKRLVDISRERVAKQRFLAIGGWPALEMTFVEEVPTRGENPPPPAFSQRAIMAVAAGARILRFDISLNPNADLALLNQALSVAQSTNFAEKSTPAALRNELRRLSQDPRLQRSPRVDATPPAPEAATLLGAAAPAAPAPSATGTAVLAQTGLGELEVSASADANTVVIASNARLSVSSNRGATFAAGNTGVFGLNDPSLGRGASGNFYLGVIAFPNGTAAQLNQTGCTNAVSRSTNGGANFTAQGFSALCPQSGAGLCFPDQEHIAADASATTAAGNDQVYAVWRNFVPIGAPPATCGAINSGVPTTSITCSQDNGANWTARAAIAGAGDFPRVAVGADGSVYVVSLSGGSVLLHKFSSCANGLAGAAGFPVTVAALTAAVACPMAGLDRCNSGNTLSSPTVAPSPTSANTVFVAFAESDNTGGERVVVSQSTNGGTSFVRRTTISGTTSARRFMPWACSTRGNAYVGWYDRRAAGAAAGATNDRTDYFLAEATASSTSLNAGFSRNLSNNPDPQCASGWPCAPRSSQDSDTCTVQPQLAGVCLNVAGAGGARCDFNTPGACPAGQVCQPGGGCPKYGDYSGIACAGDFVLAAWTSATAPAGLPAPPPAGLNVFASAESVAPLGACIRFPRACIEPIRWDRDLIRVKCLLLPCLVVDPIPKNCTMKWSCPGCEPGALCPPYYHVIFDDTLQPWSVTVVDKEGLTVPHSLNRYGKETVLTIRPSRAAFLDKQIADYRLVFTAGAGIRPDVEYPIRMRLEASDKPTRK